MNPTTDKDAVWTTIAECIKSGDCVVGYRDDASTPTFGLLLYKPLSLDATEGACDACVALAEVKVTYFQSYGFSTTSPEGAGDENRAGEWSPLDAVEDGEHLDEGDDGPLLLTTCWQSCYWRVADVDSDQALCLGPVQSGVQSRIVPADRGEFVAFCPYVAPQLGDVGGTKGLEPDVTEGGSEVETHTGSVCGPAVEGEALLVGDPLTQPSIENVPDGDMGILYDSPIHLRLQAMQEADRFSRRMFEHVGGADTADDAA
jgi:hypothetical protein